jgi:hypothetical protein
VMHNPIDPRESADVPAPAVRPSTQTEPQGEDREVSLDSAPLPDAVHAFLDGEPVSEAALSAAAGPLKLWQRIESETGRRRRMTTPAHVPMQILKRLSDD